MSCRRCGAPLAAATTGRPRLYCSAACRQRAYRARRWPVPGLPPAPEAVRTLAARLRDNAELIVLLSSGWTAPENGAELSIDDLVRDTGMLAARLTELNRQRPPE